MAELQRLRTVLRDRLRQLSDYPGLGHDDDGDGIYELSLHPLPFLLWYRVSVDNKEIRVIALFHERQDRV